MIDTKVVVLGGCGFIGSNIALHLKSYSYEVSVVDNFSRNGSLLNKKILEDSEVEVIEQSVENLTSSQIFDNHGTRTVIIDCAANPSVGAGYTDSISSLYTDNVMGLAHLLDISKGRNVHIIYLSSSRILPLNFLQSINLTIKNDRFIPGENNCHIDEFGQINPSGLSLNDILSFYGQTKLASEKLITEFSVFDNFTYTIFRPGVISGPGQFGKAEQGFVSLWLKAHLKNLKLSYNGYGGFGYQVRDILHVSDFCKVVKSAIHEPEFKNKTYWLGGGIDNSISLKELTYAITELCGKTTRIDSCDSQSIVDAPYVVFSNDSIFHETKWKPSLSVNDILLDQLNFFDKYPKFLEI